ncbi:MAG: hypothetical protein OM95_11850 [Bdellovibrio sp. ArHS]|uniref:hypothetical protein n=1 Tax=Bdellovibrio sp. ArHS TaxID=1569284 RepID=UPI000582A01A|nr:hypothetical protein [Bdellovibrio sp. ArHS]KHD87950.1 MAG: hypothetical protein OM95_11850 [Bdellovibrio sp. ArHS]
MSVIQRRFSVLAILLILTVNCARHDLTISPYENARQSTVIKEESDELKLYELALKDENLAAILRLGARLGWDAELTSSLRPLNIAIQYQRIKAIRLLRAQGAKLDLVQIEGQNATAWALNLPPEKETLKRALLVDLTLEADEVLGLIAANNYKDLKKRIDEGFNVNQHLSNGESPLTESLKKNKALALRALFLASDLDVNFANRFLEKPLALAKKMNNKKVEEELIKRGATYE